jgi:hypothetical protein
VDEVADEPLYRSTTSCCPSPGMRYHDLGPDYYERQAAIRRKIAYHVREIEAWAAEGRSPARPGVPGVPVGQIATRWRTAQPDIDPTAISDYSDRRWRTDHGRRPRSWRTTR